MYTQQSFLWYRFRMYRPVRIAAEPERSSRINARIATGYRLRCEARKKIQGVDSGRYRQRTERRVIRGEGRAGNQRRSARRSAGRGSRIADIRACQAAGYQQSTPPRRSPSRRQHSAVEIRIQDGGRRGRLYEVETGNPDRIRESV